MCSEHFPWAAPAPFNSQLQCGRRYLCTVHREILGGELDRRQPSIPTPRLANTDRGTSMRAVMSGSTI